MVKTVVVYGGHAQFQKKTKKFLESNNSNFNVNITEDIVNMDDVGKHDYVVIYKEKNMDLKGLLVNLNNSSDIDIILVGNIQRGDKILAHDYGADNFIYVPRCIGNQLDPYIREIEKAITSKGGLFG